jgi:hypothetical protein
LNTYAEKQLPRLKAALSDKSAFSVEEACQALGSKKSTTLWILSHLSSSGSIARVGRGIYTLNEKSISFRKPHISGEMINVIERLRNEGVSFVLTGLDILLPFVQHQPARILHLIYTAAGAGSWAQSLLKTTHFTPVLDPTRQEIEKILDIVEEPTELIILREKSSKLASNNSLATIERAFIDLYVEASRELVPFSIQEVAHIFINMKASVHLNTTQMVRYAHERSIREEIQNILESIEEPRTQQSTKRSEDFLKILRAIS